MAYPGIWDEKKLFEIRYFNDSPKKILSISRLMSKKKGFYVFSDSPYKKKISLMRKKMHFFQLDENTLLITVAKE